MQVRAEVGISERNDLKKYWIVKGRLEIKRLRERMKGGRGGAGRSGGKKHAEFQVGYI